MTPSDFIKLDAVQALAPLDNEGQVIPFNGKLITQLIPTYTNIALARLVNQGEDVNPPNPNINRAIAILKACLSSDSGSPSVWQTAKASEMIAFAYAVVHAAPEAAAFTRSSLIQTALLSGWIGPGSDPRPTAVTWYAAYLAAGGNS